MRKNLGKISKYFHEWYDLYTIHESKYDMQLADDTLISGLTFEKLEKLGFKKAIPKSFNRFFQDFFF